MYRWVIGIILSCLIGIPSPYVDGAEEAPSANTKTVPVLTISGAIGPAVGDYLIKEIQRANQLSNAVALVITIDTPGGLVSSLRDINQHILASNIPVLCLVYPQGARAASAGTYLLYACHIAAMSSATTLGAATPVNISGPAGGGEQKEDQKSAEPSAMEKKMLNDSIAYIRSLAQLRGRNVEWAEKAVREAATLSAPEALELNVINLIVETPAELIRQANGKSVTINNQLTVMELAGAVTEPREPDWRNQFLSTITDPNIAYILMLIGVYGLLLEFYSPGFGISGIVGAISLLIALYAFQLLPVNYVGLGLMCVGLALLVAESLIPSFGLFGISGMVAFVLGSVFLLDSDIPELRVSLNLIYGIAALSGGFIVFVLGRLLKLRKQKIVSGQEELLDSEAQVLGSFNGKGFVQVSGERWAAESQEPVEKGETVRINAVDGLTLKVSKISGSKEK